VLHALLIMRSSLWLVLALSLDTAASAERDGIHKNNEQLKNVLFIVSDDFRPNIGAYGSMEVSTPNLDRLASEGLLFKAAHVQFAYCAPSRNSFMSGRRPDTNKVWNFNNHFREPECGGDKWTSLPEHFKNHGYLVTGGGMYVVCVRSMLLRQV